jgi:hypothetical protein
LTQSDFIKFCNERNISVARERLMKLERLKLFFPMLRIYRIDTVFKIEYVEGGKRYRDLGGLKEGEEWKGDTRTRLAGFDFSARVVRSWREHGNAWDPRADASPHMASLETESRRHEAYYSPFQIAEVDRLVQQLTASVEIEWAVEDDGTASRTWGDRLKPNLSKVALETVKRGHSDSIQSLAVLCQLISDRYYPKTQSDERHITLREGGLFFRDWDWYQYCREWDAAGTAKLLDLQQDELKNKYLKWARTCRMADPLGTNWCALFRWTSAKS